MGSPATGICSPAGTGGRALVSALRVDCRLCRAASNPFDVSVCSRCTKGLSYRQVVQHPCNQVQHAADFLRSIACSGDRPLSVPSEGLQHPAVISVSNMPGRIFLKLSLGTNLELQACASIEQIVQEGAC